MVLGNIFRALDKPPFANPTLKTFNIWWYLSLFETLFEIIFLFALLPYIRKKTPLTKFYPFKFGRKKFYKLVLVLAIEVLVIFCLVHISFTELY